MPLKIKFEFSKRATSGLKYRVEKQIVNAIESSPAMRQVIRKVFQVANRRIQNIEKSGALSPAVTALGKHSGGYSKFSVSGLSWEQLKVEYGRCVAFLNQPTSTASGAREWERQFREYGGYTAEEWENIKGDMLHGYTSDIDAILEKIPYPELMQELYTRAENSARSQMERDAMIAANETQRQINTQASNIAGELADYFDSFGLGYENR